LDGNRFDATIKSLAVRSSSRRGLLYTLAGAAVRARFGLRGGCPVGAATTGCRQDGKECRRGNQCCSGRCKRGACRPAPKQDTCAVNREFCKVGAPGRCGVGDSECGCFRRLNGAAFCAGDLPLIECTDCTDEKGCRPGFDCLRARGSFCPGCAAQGLTTVCARPCAFPSNVDGAAATPADQSTGSSRPAVSRRAGDGHGRELV
jgi:hypothetical protein